MFLEAAIALLALLALLCRPWRMLGSRPAPAACMTRYCRL
jgi:hypothetical protein